MHKKFLGLKFRLCISYPKKAQRIQHCAIQHCTVLDTLYVHSDVLNQAIEDIAPCVTEGIVT